ncbi:LysR substrate-binding domain-containing protein [Rhodovulum euryhalinum]|uniref:DNA-binding transcriptional LysR family regulator n=1 Tax=Rhodovulum euryhalinum TaxID=35805 RepID=A0A4R2K9N9_9RHOB|nr:LysR substrate-binding domain-containing protein [Rhodovulum euryhalinum]TCO70123.1 DNA-binding transcriptional LysR family regulator [Rhodovulum euryhalinum]
MRKTYLPTVNELEAFVACARLGTTTMAAQALNLTQSAVSRSLSTLEARMGVALFDRVRQRLVLSAAGRAFLDRAERLLHDLNEASVGVMAFGGSSEVLRMAVLPSFARSWLIPRLAGFARTAPEIGLDISARLSPVDFQAEAVDLAIMRTQHEPPGTRREDILAEELVIVAAPHLLGQRTILSETELLDLPLLQQSTRPTLWLDWFRDSGIDPRQALRGARLDHFDMILDAVAAGMGVGLVPEIVARGAMERGHVRQATVRRMVTGEHYALILPERSLESPAAQAFRAWLLREIAG